jgi:hypothetical protein
VGANKRESVTNGFRNQEATQAYGEEEAQKTFEEDSHPAS